MKRRPPAESVWLLTADPPVCRGGNPVAVLNACERRRRLEECLCRFDASSIAEQLGEIGCDEAADYFRDELSPEEVEEVASALEECSEGSSSDDEDANEDADAFVKGLRARLAIVVDAEAGLTARYAGEVDP